MSRADSCLFETRRPLSVRGTMPLPSTLLPPLLPLLARRVPTYVNNASNKWNTTADMAVW